MTVADELTIDPTKSYTAVITLPTGEFTVELFAQDAPITVDNFVKLARDGFYDGVTFHRVIPGFMAQGGDPTGTGSGGPGYSIVDEFSDRKHDGPGVLSMANSGPTSNGSQFFVTTVPTPHLNGLHTIFGQIVQGQDVADAISLVQSGPGNRPVTPVIILGIDIAKNP